MLTFICKECKFEVFYTCGEGLCGQSGGRNSYQHGTPQVIIEPCQKCIGRVREEGYNVGYQEGQESIDA